MKIRLIVTILFLPLLVSAAKLRMEGEQAWLKAEGAPLSKVLRLFEQRGVAVMIDPALELDRVTGEWEKVKIERLIPQLVRPHSYMVGWKKTKSPLGDLYQLSSIRVFSEGNSRAVKRLSSGRTVLDIVEGKSGVKYIRSEIMVGFGEGSTIEDLKKLLAKLGGTVIEVINPPGVYRIKLNDDMSVEKAMEIAAAHEGVKATEPNLAFPKIGSGPFPPAGNAQGINLSLLPGETAVAVFDSGLDPAYLDHPLIRGAYNALNPNEAMSDPMGHGTLVSLIASGAITPVGVEAGDAGVPVLSIKVFDENGMTSSDVMMRAFQFAKNSGVNIFNLSFGSYEEIGFMREHLAGLASDEIRIIVAAGNDSTENPMYPAAYPFTVSIGASDKNGIASYSNHGPTVDVYEPGTVLLDGEPKQGSSFSAPYFAYKYALPQK